MGSSILQSVIIQSLRKNIKYFSLIYLFFFCIAELSADYSKNNKLNTVQITETKKDSSDIENIEDKNLLVSIEANAKLIQYSNDKPTNNFYLLDAFYTQFKGLKVLLKNKFSEFTGFILGVSKNEYSSSNIPPGLPEELWETESD